MAKDINKVPKAEATIKGHLSYIRKHARLTTTNKNSGEEHTHTHPIQEQHNGKKELVMTTPEKIHKIYTDQTGIFPMTSSRRKKYVIIMYVYDANAIL